MAGGADPPPARLVTGNRVVVGAATDIAELSGNALPGRAVPGPGARNGVGNFVQEYLVYLIVVSLLTEITRNGDAPFVMVTLTKPCFCVVELKTPGRIQIQPNERIGPHSNPVLLRHGHRLTRGSLETHQISTAIRR